MNSNEHNYKYSKICNLSKIIPFLVRVFHNSVHHRFRFRIYLASSCLCSIGRPTTRNFPSWYFLRLCFCTISLVLPFLPFRIILLARQAKKNVQKTLFVCFSFACWSIFVKFVSHFVLNAFNRTEAS